VVIARASGTHARPAPSAPARGARAVAWHDLECGRYRADLPLWRELAERTRSGGRAGAILDVGAGTGRVALDLASAGHSVSALELDPTLLHALRRRAGGTSVQACAGDARTFQLRRRDFALCIVAMQTLQLFGGAAARKAFLGRARAHMRPGGLIACAIVTDLEPFDCAAGDPAPVPERERVQGVLYLSIPTRVSVHTRSLQIERERVLVPKGAGVGSERALRERSLVVLDRVSAAELEREGVAVGLAAEPARTVAATADHVGSTVVMLRA
jgi:SAM-dependent methyltransferase